MPAIVRDLPSFKTSATNSTATNAIGKLDDASSITIFLASSAGISTSSGISIQIAQYDPNDPVLPVGVIESTAWYTVATTSLLSTGPVTAVLTNISFKGLRLQLVNMSVASVA